MTKNKGNPKFLDGQVQLIKKTKNVVRKLAHTRNIMAFTWENGIMKFISLYTGLQHSSYLMPQYTGSCNKERTAPPP